MKSSLSIKLFLSYVLVFLIGVLTLILITRISLPGAYGRHMGEDGTMMTVGIGMGPGKGQGTGAGQDLYSNFQVSFYEALGWAVLASLVVALISSYMISRRLTMPIKRMKIASQRIADGHFGERVPISGSDELGQLASSFNIMAQRLEEVENMRRRLIGDVAHELRTPLTTIKGSMEGLEDGILPASKETYALISHEANRMKRLVDDLQEVSRVEAGAFTLDLRSTSLQEVVAVAQKRLALAYNKKGVEFHMDIPDDLPYIMGDADRLLQVMINLLHNALIYTPAGGSVSLAAGVVDNEILIRITDTGIGIPPENLPYIFDRFYRVDKSRSRQLDGGSGIGLTIAKHFVEAHKGRIWAESKGLDQGSTFLFTIPIGSQK